jgi:hypothetical protein
MDECRKAFERVVQTIDWKKIKSYHKRLNITWEFTEDKNSFKRIPHISELKDELRSIFDHMISEDLNYISYGNWIIFWDKEVGAIGNIRVIFRIADFVYEEDKKSKESLELALERAIEKEDYEQAAEIRDELNKKETEK